MAPATREDQRDGKLAFRKPEAADIEKANRDTPQDQRRLEQLHELIDATDADDAD